MRKVRRFGQDKGDSLLSSYMTRRCISLSLSLFLALLSSRNNSRGQTSRERERARDSYDAGDDVGGKFKALRDRPPYPALMHLRGHVTQLKVLSPHHGNVESSWVGPDQAGVSWATPWSHRCNVIAFLSDCRSPSPPTRRNHHFTSSARRPGG